MVELPRVAAAFWVTKVNPQPPSSQSGEFFDRLWATCGTVAEGWPVRRESGFTGNGIIEQGPGQSDPATHSCGILQVLLAEGGFEVSLFGPDELLRDHRDEKGRYNKAESSAEGCRGSGQCENHPEVHGIPADREEPVLGKATRAAPWANVNSLSRELPGSNNVQPQPHKDERHAGDRGPERALSGIEEGDRRGPQETQEEQGGGLQSLSVQCRSRSSAARISLSTLAACTKSLISRGSSTSPRTFTSRSLI